MGHLLEGNDLEVRRRSVEPGLHELFLFPLMMTPEDCRFETLNGWQFPAVEAETSDSPSAEEWEQWAADEARALELLREAQ